MTRFYLPVLLLFYTLHAVGQGCFTPHAGAVDECFGPDSGLFENGFTYQGRTATLNKILVLPSGKYLVGGQFDRYRNTPVQSLVRLNPDGSLDPSFPFSQGINSRVNDLLLLPDRKVLVAGRFSRFGPHNRKQLVRLTATDSLDTGFDFGTGVVGTGWKPEIMALRRLPDGKLVACGRYDSVQGVPQSGLCRLFSDGRIDTAYRPVVNTEWVDRPTLMTIQTDGSVLMLNTFLNQQIARVSPDGRVVTGYVAATDWNVNCIEALPDGRFLLAGFFETVYQHDSAGSHRYPVHGLARFQANGRFDRDMNPFGSQNEQSIMGLTPMADGRILLLAQETPSYSYSSRMVCILPDGGLDSSFHSTRIYVNDSPSQRTYAIAVDTAGWVVAGGPFKQAEGVPRHGIFRTTISGQFDSNFNRVPTPWFGYNAVTDDDFGSYYAPNSNLNAIAVLPGGKLIAGGNFAGFGQDSTRRLIRLNADGTRDPGFAQAGYGLTGQVLDLAVQPDGKVIAVGDLWSMNGQALPGQVVRFWPDGRLDTTFAFRARSDQFWSTPLRDVLMCADGKMLIAGAAYTVGPDQLYEVNRLNQDGTPDTSWKFVPNKQKAHRVYQDRQGRTLTLYHDGSSPQGRTRAIYRVGADGRADSVFNQNLVHNPYLLGDTLSTLRIKAIAISPDDKIYFVGTKQSRTGPPAMFGRLNPDGTLDTTFPTGGFASSGIRIALVTDLLAQPDSSVIAVGYFSRFRGDSVPGICRILPSGQLDTGFNPGTGFSFAKTSALALAHEDIFLPRILAQGRDSAYVFGDFREFNGSKLPFLNRISIRPRNAPVNTRPRTPDLQPVTLTPNPTLGRLNITAPGYTGLVDILMVTGRPVMALQMRRGSLSADVSTLSPGLYLVRCGQRMARLVRN